jgi:predicted dehydrogenase
MVKEAVARNINVFSEKPLTLEPERSDELASLARSRGVVHQVGYHYRFAVTFREVKRLVEAGAIGQITHVLAEAYGPVVLDPRSSTWRSKRSTGGGCLYDYAAHPINLLNWYFGMPEHVAGTRIGHVFSRNTDDEVYSTLYYREPEGLTAQLSVNWSDASQRKMTTKLSFWGTNGRISADRQEVQVYLRKSCAALPDYGEGWNIRSTTELSAPVWFYLRGEEYSEQLDYFVARIADKRRESVSCFESAAQTDRVIAMLLADEKKGWSNDGKAASRKSRFFSKTALLFLSRQA